MNAADQLRDIHLPDPVSAWPPAIGWWIVLALLIIACFLLFKFIRYIKNRRVTTPIDLRAMFRNELALIKQEYKGHNDQRVLAQDISAFLRRMVIKENPAIAKMVSGQTGRAWLETLDNHFNYGHVFIQSAKVITEAPYNPKLHFNADELLQLLSDVLAQDYQPKNGADDV